MAPSLEVDVLANTILLVGTSFGWRCMYTTVYKSVLEFVRDVSTAGMTASQSASAPLPHPDRLVAVLAEKRE